VIPDREACLLVLGRQEVPDHIIRHSLMVERVALFLGGRLSGIGNEVDPALVSAGALLHDVAKIRGIAEGRPHGELGATLARDLGFAEVSPLVRQHVRLDDYADNGRVDEIKLVNYADKRVNHEEIVSLDERFAYLFDRYGSVSEDAMERLVEMRRLSGLVEAQIFTRIALEPADLGRSIKEMDHGLHSR
jgi:uncharacterized protein